MAVNIMIGTQSLYYTSSSPPDPNVTLALATNGNCVSMYFSSYDGNDTAGFGFSLQYVACEIALSHAVAADARARAHADLRPAVCVLLQGRTTGRVRPRASCCSTTHATRACTDVCAGPTMSQNTTGIIASNAPGAPVVAGHSCLWTVCPVGGNNARWAFRCRTRSAPPYSRSHV
jgi:hypothetical protein